MSKKNNSKKSNKVGSNPVNEEIQKAEKVNKNDGKVKALQQILINEQNRADKCKAQENEIKVKVFECEIDLKREKEKTVSIVCDMTRIYKQTQKQLQERIDELKSKVQEKEQILNEKSEFITSLKTDQEYQLRKKDDDINELKRRIEEMSSEFAKMLRDTLDKMQDRIEFAQWDQETDPNTVNKIKNIVGYVNN